MQNEREQGIGTMSRSMLIVMIFTMVGKLAGFFRETVFANYFGAGVIKSAFVTAQDVPCIILSIIVTGFCTTMVPAYATQLKQGPEKANRFVSNLFTIGMVVSIVVLTLTMIFVEPLTNLAMLETDDMEARQLVIQMARIMMPMGIFVFLSRMISAYLQANFNFTVPAISQLFLNIVIIAAIMLSGGGDNITFVAVGVVLGWALQFLVQVPAARRAGLAYRPTFDFKESGFQDVLVLMIPVLIASTFDQLYMWMDRMVAFRGDIGDPGKLDYANRLTTMVSSVLLTTVATVLYPNLVKSVSNRDRFADNLSFGINLNVLIAVPAAVAMIMLSIPITRIVYERGQFSAESTLQTAPLIASYAAGILGMGLRELCNRCFYAYKKPIIPTVVGIGVVLVNIGLNYLLHSIMGVTGIALATAISLTGSGLILLFLAHKQLHVVDWKRILRCLMKTVLATAGMAAVLLALYQVFGMATRAGRSLWLGMGISVIVGVAVYLLILWLCKTEELGMVVRAIKKKLGRA